MQIKSNFSLYNNHTSESAPQKRESPRAREKKYFIFVFAIAFTLLVVSLLFFNSSVEKAVFTDSAELTSDLSGNSSVNSIFASFKPSIIVSLSVSGGEERKVQTEPVPLKKFFEEQNIVLDETSNVNYPLYTVVFAGMNIVVDSIQSEQYSVTAPVPCDVDYIKIGTIPKGTVQIISDGVPGEKTIVHKATYKNGQLENDEIINEYVSVSPVNQKAYLGSGGKIVGIDGVEHEYSYYIDVEATCYGHADGSGYRTATGKETSEGIIAVDPNVISLGSKCYVLGSGYDLGVCFAEDVGGAIKGNRIDVFREGTLAELLSFGRRNMRVYILI